MAERGLWLALEFRDDALSQHLAQFDAPLVERIDAPDRALSEDRVLIEGDELAERVRCEPIGEDCVRRAVALEDAVWYEPSRRGVGLDILTRLPAPQRRGPG